MLHKLNFTTPLQHRLHFLILPILLLLYAFAGHAGQRIVTDTASINSCGTMYWAMSTAQSGDTILFSPELNGLAIGMHPQGYSMSTNKTLYIIGNGPDSTVFNLYGGNFVTASSGTQVHVRNIGFTNWKPSGSSNLSVFYMLGGETSISNCHFDNSMHPSTGHSAVRCVSSGSRVSMSGCTFIGTGLVWSYGVTHITNCRAYQAPDRLIFCGNGNNSTDTTIVDGLVAEGNSSTNDMISLRFGHLEFKNSVLRNNTVGSVVFKIVLPFTSGLISNNQFSGNTTTGKNIIELQQGAEFSNNTVVDNHALTTHLTDGIIFLSDTATLSHNTIAYNDTAGLMAAVDIVDFYTSRINLVNNIIYHNGGVDVYGPHINQNVGNIVGNCNSCGLTFASTADPLFDPSGITDNGGPTATLALQASSPAIDAADVGYANAADQRGYSAVGARDIGAFEYNATGACDEAVLFGLDASTISGTGFSTITVRGELRDATKWYLYSGSCGGTLVDSATTDTATWSKFVTTETTWYVQAGGACPTTGCGTATTYIVSTGQVDIDVTITNPCPGTFSGSALATPTSGSAPYTYSWSGGSTTNTQIALGSMSSWSVTVTASGGCSGSKSGTIPFQFANLSINGGSLGCDTATNGARTAFLSGGTTPYTYAWSNGGTTQTISGLSQGSYTVTVTDANGCTTEGSSNVNVNPLSVSSSSYFLSLCASDSAGGAVVGYNGATAPYTFAWSTPLGSGSSLSNALPGEYYVTVTESTGCVIIDTVVVSGPDPIVSNAIVNTPTCAGDMNGSIMLAPSGGTSPYTYAWGGGATTSARFILGDGMYPVTVTDANGCELDTMIAISTPGLSIQMYPGNVHCPTETGEMTAVASGGAPTPYTYSWSNGGSTDAIYNLTPGPYTVTITDANNCTETSSASVLNINDFNASTFSWNFATCAGDSMGGASVGVGGGTSPYTFTWSSILGSGSSLSNAPAGKYYVTVNDAGNCLVEDSVEIIDPPGVQFNGTATDATCNLSSDGAAAVALSGGTAPYTYIWSNGLTTSSYNALPAGLYQISVTDASGCTSDTMITIGQSNPLLSNLVVTHDDCASPGTASMSVAPTGGTPPYTYNWSNSATTASISNLPTGYYSIQVLDANGCIASSTKPIGYVCEQPSNLRHMNVQDTSVIFTWDTVCGATKYKVFWKLDGPGAWNVEIKEANVGRFELTGLTPGTDYRWSVKPDCGASGWGLTAVQQSFTTLDEPCVIPDGLSAGPVGNVQTRLNWNKQSTTHKYRIRWREAGGTWTTISKDSIWDKHWLTGLTPTTTYEWQIKSVCEMGAASGTDWSATQSFTTAMKTNSLLNHASSAAVVAVYPNPSNGQFTLHVQGLEDDATVTILDMTGKVVLQKIVRAGSDRHEINLFDCSAGIYTLRIASEHYSHQKRIAVQ